MLLKHSFGQATDHNHPEKVTQEIIATVDYNYQDDSWTFVSAVAVDNLTGSKVQISDILYDLLGFDKELEKIDWRQKYQDQRPPIHSHRWGNVNPVFHQSLMGILK